MIVVDINIIAYLLIKGKFTKDTEKLLRNDPQWKVPLLWKSEFRNILATYVRNKYLNLSQAMFLMKRAEALLLHSEYKVQSADVLQLAEQSGCSAYDCEFVALAKDLGVQLVTTDKQILKAFPKDSTNLAETGKEI